MRSHQSRQSQSEISGHDEFEPDDDSDDHNPSIASTAASTPRIDGGHKMEELSEFSDLDN